MISLTDERVTTLLDLAMVQILATEDKVKTLFMEDLEEILFIIWQTRK